MAFLTGLPLLRQLRPVSHSMTATVAQDDNYNELSLSSPSDFTINRAASSITATGSTTLTYNGAAQGPASSFVTGSTGAGSATATAEPPTVAFLPAGLPRPPP